MPAPEVSRDTLSLALELGRQGYHVFPLIENGRLPAIGAWQHQASNKSDDIRRMWTKRTYDPVNQVHRETIRPYNIGICTSRFGDGDECLVGVDVDVKNGKDGPLSLQMLDFEYGTPGWLDTRRHRSASGGQHYLYRSPSPTANTQSKIGKNIDTRGVGGFLVAPGSIIDGRAYEVEDAQPPALAPKWLVDAIGKPIQREATTVVELLDTPIAVERARSWLDSAPPAVEGNGGDGYTYEVACKVGDYGVSELTALELMLEWNERCQPPWDYEELAVKVGNAYHYRKLPLGQKDASADFEAIPEDPKEQDTALLPLEEFGSIKVDFTHTELIEGWLDQLAMSVMYGQSNVGKTFAALSVSYAIATGQQWGVARVKQGAVVYLAAEAGNSARKRLMALQRHFQPQHEVPLALIPSSVDLLKANGDWKKVVATVKAYEERTDQKVELLVIDTLSRVMSGGNENAPDDMGRLVANLDRIRAHIKAHVMVVHHSGKDQARGARGHSLLRAATDTEIEVDDGVIRATKQRDMEAEKPVPFELHEVVIGELDGEAKTSAVALIGRAPADVDFEGLNLTQAEAEVLRDLELAIRDHGRPVAGRIAASGDDWRECFVNRNNSGVNEIKDLAEKRDRDRRSRLMSFRKHKSALVKKMAVVEIAKNQWVID